MRKMNSAAATGFMLCLTTLIFGIVTNGGIGAALGLIHPPSMIVTFGGALCAALMTADSFSDFIDCIRSFAAAFQSPAEAPSVLSEHILELSDIARKDGLLSLEEQARDENDAYLRQGLMLIVDGTDSELVKDILDTESEKQQTVGQRHIKFWQDLGSYGPAWGMIGTLLGLINMMGAMGDDPSAVGSGMSLALLTTLYGSILANWICIPIARKLEKYYDERLLYMNLCEEGVLSIQAGDNPRLLREKLNAVMEDV